MKKSGKSSLKSKKENLFDDIFNNEHHKEIRIILKEKDKNKFIIKLKE